jgi:hypothetical protein
MDTKGAAMITDADRIAAERELAELLGWTNVKYNLETTSPTGFGKPPNELWNCALPKWTRDWSACGPLIGEYGLQVEAADDDYIVVKYAPRNCAFLRFPINDHPTKDDAIRYAIVQAVIAKLKAEKESK